MKVDILIADDHPLTVIGTKSFVTSLGHTVQNVCSNGIAAYNLIKAHQPSIAILDINMPGMTGLEILEKIYTERLRTKVILLTMHKEFSIFNKAKNFGLYGYLLKENALDELEDCIESVLKKEVYLSKKMETEVLYDFNESNHSVLKNLTQSEVKITELIANQYSTKQIAEALFISDKTVEKHRTNIIDKLNLPKEKNSLMLWAINNKDLFKM